MGQFGIGQSVTRFEDPRLLRGEGRFIHDVGLPGQLYAVFVRSPHAHAKIVSIDTAAAKRSPGVLAVYTIADLDAEGIQEIPTNKPETSTRLTAFASAFEEPLGTKSDPTAECDAD